MKNLKCPFILFAVFSAFIIGWQTVSNNLIFSGVSVPFVALVLILAALTFAIVTNKELRHRILDLYIVACVFVVLEFIVYLVLEFSLGNSKTWQGFITYQNVLCVLGLIYLIYIVFRAIYEAKGLNLTGLEIILGNKKPVKKVKQAKEFANGSLEAKPNQKHLDEQKVDEPAAEQTDSQPVEQNTVANEDNSSVDTKQEGEE